MRSTNARETTDPGLSPSGRQASTPSTRQAHGRTALGSLPTTAAFSNPRLSPHDRTLLLFVLVVMAGEQEPLTHAYQQILTTFGHVPGHWCAGKDVKALRGQVSKFLGKGAHILPTWDKVDDIFTAVLAPEERERLLPWAAGLYCQARNKRSPAPDYEGPIELPPWAHELDVSVETIRESLADRPPKAERVSDPAATESPVPTHQRTVDAENTWVVLMDVTREYMNLLRRYEALDAEVQELRKHRKENWQLRGDNARLARAAEDILAQLFPQSSPETVRNLLDDMLTTPRGSQPPRPRGSRLTSPRPPLPILLRPESYLAAAPPAGE